MPRNPRLVTLCPPAPRPAPGEPAVLSCAPRLVPVAQTPVSSSQGPWSGGEGRAAGGGKEGRRPWGPERRGRTPGAPRGPRRSRPAHTVAVAPRDLQNPGDQLALLRLRGGWLWFPQPQGRERSPLREWPLWPEHVAALLTSRGLRSRVRVRLAPWGARFACGPPSVSRGAVTGRSGGVQQVYPQHHTLSRLHPATHAHDAHKFTRIALYARVHTLSLTVHTYQAHPLTCVVPHVHTHTHTGPHFSLSCRPPRPVYPPTLIVSPSEPCQPRPQGLRRGRALPTIWPGASGHAGGGSAGRWVCGWRRVGMSGEQVLDTALGRAGMGAEHQSQRVRGLRGGRGGRGRPPGPQVDPARAAPRVGNISIFS